MGRNGFIDINYLFQSKRFLDSDPICFGSRKKVVVRFWVGLGLLEPVIIVLEDHSEQTTNRQLYVVILVTRDSLSIWNLRSLQDLTAWSAKSNPHVSGHQ